MIDRIRHDIQERLEQLLGEADKLRRALAALDPRGHSTPPPAPTTPKVAAAKPKPAATSRRAPAKPAPASEKATRAPAGKTREAVLGALSSEKALTAADVATATGLARQTVSTTLSRLAKSGAVTKADRGYVLPGTADATVPSASTETA